MNRVLLVFFVIVSFSAVSGKLMNEKEWKKIRNNHLKWYKKACVFTCTGSGSQCSGLCVHDAFRDLNPILTPIKLKCKHHKCTVKKTQKTLRIAIQRSGLKNIAKQIKEFSEFITAKLKLKDKLIRKKFLGAFHSRVRLCRTKQSFCSEKVIEKVFKRLDNVNMQSGGDIHEFTNEKCIIFCTEKQNCLKPCMISIAETFQSVLKIIKSYCLTHKNECLKIVRHKGA